MGFPFTICWLIYVWLGKTEELFGIYFYSIINFDAEQYLSYKSIFVLTGITILLYIFSAFKILSGFGFTIFQVRIQKIMFFGSMVTLFVFVFYSDKDGYSLIMFFPWVAFFLSHFLSLKFIAVFTFHMFPRCSTLYYIKNSRCCFFREIIQKLL